jgi:hypothetical protein
MGLRIPPFVFETLDQLLTVDVKEKKKNMIKKRCATSGCGNISAI